MTDERWRAIKGYESLYAVSDRGRVKSLRNGRVLSPMRVTDGYLGVKLYRAGRCTNCLIHRLVCAAFNGPPNAGQQAAHLDGIRTNNDWRNLAWTSPKENTSHKRLHGTHQAGEAHPRARLTEEQVAEIRAAPKGGRALADRFGISPVTARQIRAGMRWT